MGRRRTGGALLAATALVSTVLVSATTGVSGAEAISAKVPLVCVGADAKTNETLALAKGLIGSDKVFVDLLASAADIPSNAALDQEIDATFKWNGTMDQNLIDKAAGLGLKLDISNIKASMAIRGPADIDAFQTTGTNKVITPVAGQPAMLDIGTIGSKIRTTAGGIITYRVAGVTLTAALAVAGQNFVLNLTCSATGSNLITKTTVKDPDAPVFSPEVLKLTAAAGGTVSADLLGDVIKPGKTPLIADSLRIVEAPAGGKAELVDGRFTFTAPNTAGTYSTTVEVCGEPKPESGLPGVDEVQKLQLGDNWSDGVIGPRPVGFTLKFGDEETRVIWTAETTLGPILDPLPRGGKMPNSKDWAPENRAGQVNDYLVGVAYKKPSVGDVQRALEALPSIGKGNIEVTALKENPKNASSVTGFSVRFIGALAQQDVPAIELASWFAVPPQEMLDRIGALVAGLAGSMGGEEGGDTSVTDALNAAAGIKDTDSQSQKVTKANNYIGDKLRASITGGPAVTDAEWNWWVGIVVLNPIMDNVPAIIAWINSLFPKKVAASTLVAGEAPIPPEPLCAQGIIDVTVAGASVSPGGPESNNPGGGQGPGVLSKNTERSLRPAG